MPRVRDVLLGLLGVAAVLTPACADMMTGAPIHNGFLRTANVYRTNETRKAESTDFSDYSKVVGIDFGSVDFTRAPIQHRGRTSETEPAKITTDKQSSVRLCLSALIGLGLCSSVHSLKKLHFDFIPEWYHNGGPYQIGHSFAVNPDTSCPARAYCFIQPDREAGDPMPIFHQKDIVSLWRQPQLTPNVIASRGPPLTS